MALDQRVIRTFEDYDAVRTSVPLLIGLMGPSNGGKTYSALRLATGIQRVSGGDIFVIDTESRRALHYAERFKFRHVPFTAPFGSLDYLAAIRHCANKGAKTIIIDSMSHEHEGPGGHLEMHEEEVQRLVEKSRYPTDPDKQNFPAWARPKAERRRLINSMMQFPCNYILCFRAKEKIKPKGGKLEALGFMPIAGEEFVFEMTINALLLPGAGGVPTWQSNEPGERLMIKLPDQFQQQLLNSKAPLSEDTGAMLATWAAGSSSANTQPRVANSSAALAFMKNYPQWGGKPIESASTEEIARYIATLDGVLSDPSKRAHHASTTKHKAAVEALFEQMRAEEAMQGATDDEGFSEPPADYQLPGDR